MEDFQEDMTKFQHDLVKLQEDIKKFQNPFTSIDQSLRTIQEDLQKRINEKNQQGISTDSFSYSFSRSEDCDEAQCTTTVCVNDECETKTYQKETN